MQQGASLGWALLRLDTQCAQSTLPTYLRIDGFWGSDRIMDVEDGGLLMQILLVSESIPVNTSG